MKKRTLHITRLGRLAILSTLTATLTACPSPPPTAPEADPEPEENQAPTASAGPDAPASIGIAVTLEGSGSDPDGDPITFSWTLETPPGSAATLDRSSGQTTSFTPDVPGNYTATLVTSDGVDDSAPDAVTIVGSDNTVSATIGAGGGTVAFPDGTVALEVPAGAVPAGTQTSVTPLAPSQFPAVGEELADELGDGRDALLLEIRYSDEDSTVVPSSDSFLQWETETKSEADTTIFTIPEAMRSDGVTAEPVDEQSTDVDLEEGTVTHSASVASSGFFAFVPNKLELEVIGLPGEARVGESFDATVIGTWLAPEAAPEQAEIGSVHEGAVTRLEPAFMPVRLDVIGNAFLTDFEFRCEEMGLGRIYMSATALRQRGGPADDGLFPVTFVHNVACTLFSTFPLGLHEVSGLSDIEAVAAVRGPLGSVDNAGGDAVLLGGREGVIVRGVSDNRVIVDGIVLGSQNPITRAVPVSRPNPGEDTPAAIFGSGIDFNSPLAPNGLWRYAYDIVAKSYEDTPTVMPGAYWDMTTAGGPVTEEVVAATNFGVDFIQWDGTTWEHNLDARFPLGRYGNEREVVIGSVVAAEAYGPLLVGVGSNFRNPGKLFFDDRGVGGPVEVGELGLSPAMIRCAIPVCVSIQARDGTARGIMWDGVIEPTIVGDPIPVGLDPGAVAVYGLPDVTLAAAFTGWTDDDVTLLEFDDSAAMLSSKTLDLGVLGCRGPRNGDWMDNPEDPTDPYLVIGCFNSSAYYLALRSSF